MNRGLPRNVNDGTVLSASSRTCTDPLPKDLPVFDMLVDRMFLGSLGGSPTLSIVNMVSLIIYAI